jgi:hypothetical protein
MGEAPIVPVKTDGFGKLDQRSHSGQRLDQVAYYNQALKYRLSAIVQEWRSSPMRLKTLRTVVGTTSVIAIAGMIVSAILNHIGSVIAFGSLGAIGILVMVASTTTLKADSTASLISYSDVSSDDLEADVANIVSKYNVPEDQVRGLIRRSVSLARRNK